jgi:hypothetical protein
MRNIEIAQRNLNLALTTAKAAFTGRVVSVTIDGYKVFFTKFPVTVPIVIEFEALEDDASPRLAKYITQAAAEFGKGGQ